MAEATSVGSMEFVRRQALSLLKAAKDGDTTSTERIRAHKSNREDMKLADAPHALAREAGQESWPKFKFPHEAAAMDRAQRAERLKNALDEGQHWRVEAVLAEDPSISHENLGRECALYDARAVAGRLAEDPSAANRVVGVREPILHLKSSRHWQDAG